MAESAHPQRIQKKDTATITRVDFIINTYPDLQPFLEMAVVLLEGVYEHVRVQASTAPTDHGKPKT